MILIIILIRAIVNSTRNELVKTGSMVNSAWENIQVKKVHVNSTQKKYAGTKINL
jgi:hypothetical protein